MHTDQLMPVMKLFEGGKIVEKREEYLVLSTSFAIILVSPAKVDHLIIPGSNE